MVSLIDILQAGGPHPEFADKLMLFGQFVGSWDLEVTWFEAGAVQRRERGEWHFFWVLDGRGVQDVWIVPPRDAQRSGASAYEYGTSLRFYDPKIDAWRSTWIGPVNGVVISFIARAQGDTIVLDGQNPAGLPLQWIFSDITSDSFRWHNLRSEDGGRNWLLQQEFAARRVG